MADILTPDLCIIGAGAGGLALAEAARAFGASVVLVERGRLGGLSLNAGDVPAKALQAAGAHAQSMRTGGPFGISPEEPRINTRRMHDHLDQVISAIAPGDSEAKLQAIGAELIKADARFIDQRTVSAGETLIRARRFVIATGARPVVPIVPGLDAIPYFTTETIFDNTRKLTHLLIIGAGPLGLELAQAYRRIGTQVTVIESGTPLAKSDPELATIALRRMIEEGVDIRANTEVTQIQPRSMGIGVAVKSGEAEQMLDVSHVLVATGRAPNLEGLDLDKADIRRAKADPRFVELTAGLRTSNRRVFVIGDAASGEQSTHLAEYQAQLVAANVLFRLPVRQRPDAIPTVTYTDPGIAEVGLTEAAAHVKHKGKFVVSRWSFADNDRARANRQTFGTAKLITGKAGRILGAGIVGDGAGELIALFAFAIANRLSAKHLMAFVAPYPTYAEIARKLGLQYYRGLGANPLLRQLVDILRYLP
jgi:pyruvate/2-oxoglutarate dehydrogenase complex dihydrolipoamide dehydrogenase (E3) component